MNNNTNFTTSFQVEQEPAEVFNAILNFRGWWSEEIEGKTDTLNEVFFYHYKDVHLCKLQLIEMIPDQKLVYLILENDFNFTQDKTEWINTRLIFEIKREEDKTTLHFTHEGLTPEYECYEICHDSWLNYINKSLFNLITMGKGSPNPKEGEGYNAEVVRRWKLG